MGRHADESPVRSERVRVVRGAHPFGVNTRLAYGIGDAGANTFEALGWAIGDMRRRKRVARLLKRAGEPVPIGEARDGLVRVEGRVGLLSPVHTPDDEPAATYRVHEAREERCACNPRCRAEVVRVRHVRDVGRFAVQGPTGVAVVERSTVVLLDYRGNALDPFAGGELVVREGDPVTVIGEGRRRSAGSLRAVHLAGYRDSTLPLVFEGTRDAPVWVFGPPGTVGR